MRSLNSSQMGLEVEKRIYQFLRTSNSIRLVMRITLVSLQNFRRKRLEKRYGTTST